MTNQAKSNEEKELNEKIVEIAAKIKMLADLQKAFDERLNAKK